MAKPIKFQAKIPRFKIVNKCVICGRVIPSDKYICGSCKRKFEVKLKRK